jgi:aminopeptidase N
MVTLWKMWMGFSKFNNTVPEDLWSLFKNFSGLDLDLNLQNAAKNWTYRAGYPVVHVTTNGTDVVITQVIFYPYFFFYVI